MVSVLVYFFSPPGFLPLGFAPPPASLPLGPFPPPAGRPLGGVFAGGLGPTVAEPIVVAGGSLFVVY